MRWSAEPQPSPSPHTYPLYVREEVVGQLQWRPRATRAPGWYLQGTNGAWRRLAVDAGLDASLATEHPGVGAASVEDAEVAAWLSTALALDAAATLLRGPPPRPARRLPSGRYEVHASGFPRDVVPIAFPETIAVHVGDVSVLAGHFDDLALTAITRRIALLGGRLLALFHADDRPPRT